MRLTGKLEYAQVEALYAQANLFLFTGLVSASGDRDGFPNVIGEAMAHSLPVFTTDVSGTTEGVRDGVRGTVVDLAHPLASRRENSRSDAGWRQVTASYTCCV